MSPKEFNYSLLLDRLQSTLETIQMYHPSFKGGNPSVVVVDRMQDLFNQLYDAFDACQRALDDYTPHLGEVSRYERIKADADSILLDFQTMIRGITIDKLRSLI